MSCGVSLENLKNFDKQIDEQASTLSKQIQQLESQLITAKNSYLKAVELDSDYFDAHNNLASLYLDETASLIKKMNNLCIKI